MAQSRVMIALDEAAGTVMNKPGFYGVQMPNSTRVAVRGH
jgi:hypothetical protein